MQRRELLRNPPLDRVRVVARLDLEVPLQQTDDGQIRRPLPIGGGTADEDQRVMNVIRVDELPQEPRLAHTRLADDRDRLAVSILSMLESLGELLQLAAAAHERREART